MTAEWGSAPDVIWLVAILVGIPTLLAVLERPQRTRRYSGSVYDPQLRVRVQSQADKSGMRATHAVEAAIRVGQTGRVCGACGVTTFGYSPRCGRCGFENKSLNRPSLLATASTKSVPSSLSSVPAPTSRGTRRRGAGSAS